MKTKTALMAALFIAALSLPMTASAGGGTYNGDGEWLITAPSAVSFSSTVQNGAAAFVLDEVTEPYTYLYQISCLQETYPTESSATADNEAAGNYLVGQELDSPISGYPTPAAQTVVSW